MDFLTIGPESNQRADIKRLKDAGKRFDAVYLQAGLSNEDALVNSVIAWSLLKIGGVFSWHSSYADDAGPEANVVSMFYRAFGRHLEETRRDDVVTVTKLAEHPGEVILQ